MQSIAKITKTPVFFIIGRPRSGTTLLRHLFDAHPNIIIPTECIFILALSKTYKHKKKFDKQTLINFLTDLRQTKSFDTLSLNNELLEKNILSADENINYSELCKLVHASYISVHDKNEIKIIGDKNPAYSNENFSRIFSLFPDSKYIHIVRDYRDHIVSMLTANFNFPSPAFITLAWKKSLLLINRYKQKFPDNFYTLRYEDFVVKPEDQFERMCSFLNIPYQADVFNFINKKEEYYNHQPSIQFEQLHKSLFFPVTHNHVGIWHSYLSGRDLAVIEKISGKVAEEYGYTKTTNKSNISILFTILKWRLLYNIFAFLRTISFTLSLQKRNKIIYKLKKSKFVLTLYTKIIFRKTAL